MRKAFNTVFLLREDGTPVNKVTLGIAATIFPPGTPFPKSFRFAGINIAEHVGHEIVAEEYDGVVDLKGFVYFPPDPANLDRVKGFAVVRRSPWHFVNFYSVKYEAEVEQKRMGKDYEVLFGSHRSGSDDFVFDA